MKHDKESVRKPLTDQHTDLCVLCIHITHYTKYECFTVCVCVHKVSGFGTNKCVRKMLNATKKVLPLKRIKKRNKNCILNECER